MSALQGKRGRFAVLFLVSVVLVVVLIAIQRDIQRRKEQENLPSVGVELPPDHALLPEFSLLERNGQTVSRHDFWGQPTVVSFVFTRCHETCPMVTGVMARLRQVVPPTVRMASITVDPRYDRVEQLRIYASSFGADGTPWWFLTGERDSVYQLIREGFKLPVEENPDPGRLPGELISHTTRLAVLDREARLRGYYDCRHPDVVAAVVRRLEVLEQEK